LPARLFLLLRRDVDDVGRRVNLALVGRGDERPGWDVREERRRERIAMP
jgi:hypothetical protein